MNKKQLRKKLALMLANLKKKRPFYTEVEYLESTGTQYIDTGVIGNGEFDVDYIYYQTQDSSNAIFAGTRSSSQHLNFGQRSNGASSVFSMAYLGEYWPAKSSPAINTKIRVQISYKSGSQTGSLNGVSLTGKTFTGTEATNLSIYLFKRNHFSTDNVVGLVGRIYYFKLWKDGALVRDFIPVLDWDMTPCMYDKVTGQLFYNAGTGDFTAGRQIHQVDYIQTIYSADSKSFIDTGYYPNFNTKVEFMASGISADSFSSSSTGTWFTGGRQAYQQKMFGSHYNPSNQSLYFGFSTSQNNSYYSSSSMYGDNKKFTLDKTGLYINDVKIVNNTTMTAFTSPATLAIFALNNNGTVLSFTGYKLQYYKIWDNDTLVRDFIPAIDENGVGYMFDRVSHTIYDNAGTGSFKYPAREVEYLESTGTQYIDCGVGGDLTTELTCEAAIVQAGDASVTNIMGNNVTSSRAITINMSANITNPSVSRIRFGNTDNTTVAGAIDLNKFYKYDTNKNELTVRDSSGTVLNIYPFNATTAFTTNGNILIYKLGDTSTQYIGKIKVKSATIKNSGVLVRDFIPCYKDGVLGFLNKVDGTFFTNSGTGQFLTGKIVESEYE